MVKRGLELIFSLNRAQCITEQFEPRNHRVKRAAKAHFALSDVLRVLRAIFVFNVRVSPALAVPLLKEHAVVHTHVAGVVGGLISPTDSVMGVLMRVLKYAPASALRIYTLLHAKSSLRWLYP